MSEYMVDDGLSFLQGRACGCCARERGSAVANHSALQVQKDQLPAKFRLRNQCRDRNISGSFKNSIAGDSLTLNLD